MPLFVIFKAKKVPRDVQDLEDEKLKLSANSTAWMDVKAFEDWIQRIWAPYCRQFSRTLLVMDHFKAHTAPSVLEKLAELNTDVLLVPPGLTYYTQPCDVYLNGPLKARIRQRWQDYMVKTKIDETTGTLFLFNLIPVF